MLSTTTDENNSMAVPNNNNNMEHREEEEEDPLPLVLTTTTTGKKRSMVRRCSLYSTLKKFSPLLSTEEYNSTTTEEGFYGPYQHLRRELDYTTYHLNYRKERQWLQDSIIEDMLDNVDTDDDDSDLCITPTEPWLIFSVGPRGAGKRHVIKRLVKDGNLPLLSFVMVDPDEIRRRLPEFSSYVKKAPDSVDALTSKESGFIAEIILLAALQAGRNVIVDGILRDAAWHVQLIDKLRQQYSSLKFAVLNVTAPAELVIRRSQKKALDTGRVLSREDSMNEMESIPVSLDVIKPAIDYYCNIQNGEEEDDSLELVDDGEEESTSWRAFQLQFLQTCAWKPGMMMMNGKRQQKLRREVTREESIRSLQLTLARPKLRRTFSVLISSEENNRANHMNFFGTYSHIRKTLDYKYHANYTFERQKLQDAIISDMLDDAIILDVDGKIGTVPTEPWIVFTAGAMGAGKSHTMNILVEKGRFPLKAFVIVDPDEIRRLLPEYHMYIDENPELAGQLTRKEAGYIAEILTLSALQAGKNVLQDGSLRDSEWYKIYFERLKKEFPIVRQAIIHVTAPREAVFQRAAERAIITGRIVPRNVLEAALEQVPRSVNILAPLVDYYAEIKNDQNSSTDVELMKPTGATWEEFKSQWHQTVAYVPNRKKILEKAKQVCKQVMKPVQERIGERLSTV